MLFGGARTPAATGANCNSIGGALLGGGAHLATGNSLPKVN